MKRSFARRISRRIGSRTGALLLAGMLVGPACRRQEASRDTAPTETSARPATAGKRCFDAVGDGAQPSQGVFDELGRSGNGETWRAILEHALRQRATVGPEIQVASMGIGWQYAVTFEHRRTWAGFDAEAGGALFCTDDAGLFTTMKGLYDSARRDASALRALLRPVPAEAWDD